jgi:hypothetical protein
VVADRGADGLASRLDLAVQATHVGQQFPGDALALEVDAGDRVDPVQQVGGPGGRQLAVGAAGLQVS